MSGFRAFIVIRAPNGDVREVLVASTPVVLGRDESSDVQVEDKKVSRRHAAFKLVDGRPWVEDLGSINGIKVNGEKVDQGSFFGPGDEVRIGGYVIRLKEEASETRRRYDDSEAELGAALAVGTDRVPVRPSEPTPILRLVGQSPPVQNRAFELSTDEVIVGRLDECDVVLLHPSVSRQHARIVFRPEEPKLTVHDLDSANGVFVNGKRVRWADLRSDDRLTVGSVAFQVELEPELPFERLPTRQRVRTSPAWLTVGMGLLGLAAAAGLLFLSVYGKGSGFSSDSPPSDSSGPSNPGPEASKEASAPGPTAMKTGLWEGARPRSAERAVTPATFTATGPYTRRASDGLPVHLPEVDSDFDLDSAIQDALLSAKRAEARAEYDAFRAQLDRLLELDPLHPEGLELQERATLYTLSNRALTRAQELEKAGKLAEAYQVLDQVPERMPLRAEAERRSAKLAARAFEDALVRSGRALRNKNLEEAHRLATFALSLKPEHREALERVRKTERSMRRRKMAFRAYRPRAAPVDPATTDGLDEVIRQKYDGSPGVAAVVLRYARGDVQDALRRARRVSPRERRSVDDAVETIKDLKRRYDRIRTEVSNDPSRAWSLLLAMKSAESKLLPASSKSYLVRELEVALSDAFAERGASKFREKRFEDAYRKWQAGYRLDPTHPDILGGLSELEKVARKLAQEAELRGQRGDKTACDQWRRITQMTGPDSDVHQRARRRASQTCM